MISRLPPLLALLLVAGCAALTPFGRASLPEAEGLVVLESENSVDDTFRRLERAVESREPLSILARVDHAANARSVGLRLPPTKLLVFGNPRLGTPLMRLAPTVAIDLPQKMLVYEDDRGRVFIAYNDPLYLAERHGIDDEAPELEQMIGALRGLAAEAGGR